MSTPLPADCEVLIVGGGPTGLFLAALLARRGVDVLVLERRRVPSQHSRAVGLHPPALRALREVGLERAVLERGQRIRTGHARCGRRRLGALPFTRAWPTHPFVLTLPQQRTEALLAERLDAIAPDALHRGCEVTRLQDSATGTAATVQLRAAGRSTSVRAGLVVGADGSGSTVRELLGIKVRGRTFPDRYLMGDFDVSVGPGDRDADGGRDGQQEAVIRLEPGGVVESFPLPGGRRRWVVHSGAAGPLEPFPEVLTRAVHARLGTAPDPTTASMVSAFAVHHRTADRLLTARCVLLGDAAHEISPIGGQGMTRGWLDALDIAPLLVAHAGRSSERARCRIDRDPQWRRAERRIRTRARCAGAVATLNTVLGRPTGPAGAALRSVAVAAALRSPLRHVMAWVYSMGWVRAIAPTTPRRSKAVAG